MQLDNLLAQARALRDTRQMLRDLAKRKQEEVRTTMEESLRQWLADVASPAVVEYAEIFCDPSKKAGYVTVHLPDLPPIWAMLAWAMLADQSGTWKLKSSGWRVGHHWVSNDENSRGAWVPHAQYSSFSENFVEIVSYAMEYAEEYLSVVQECKARNTARGLDPVFDFTPEEA